MRPFEVEPSSWPARPTRCRPRATDFGLSTWITRSTAPMSIPSSRLRGRDEARDPPRLQLLLDHDPLLARERAVVGARDLFLGELVQPHREPLGEAPVVDEDDRRAVLPRRARGAPGRSRARSSGRSPRSRRPSRRRPCTHGLGELVRGARARAGPRPGRRPRGRAPCACRRRRAGSGGRRRRSGRSPRAGAASPRGRSAATGSSSSASRRSSESARWAPRFVPATACTSSTITRLDRRAASRGPARSASGRATPAS